MTLILRTFLQNYPYFHKIFSKNNIFSFEPERRWRWKWKKWQLEKIAISTKTEGETGGILIVTEAEMVTLILMTFCKTILIFTKYFQKIIFLVSNQEEDEGENEKNYFRKNSNINENGRGYRGHTNPNGNGNDDFNLEDFLQNYPYFHKIFWKNNIFSFEPGRGWRWKWRKWQSKK